jgi:hypothetical protein
LLLLRRHPGRGQWRAPPQRGRRPLELLLLLIKIIVSSNVQLTWLSGAS